MIIYDKDNNDNGRSQGTLYMQGMDILFLISNFDKELLLKKMASDFFEYIMQVSAKITSEVSKSKREFLLRESHQFGIEFSEIDSEFKNFIESLVSENILYSRERLSAIPMDDVESKIALFTEVKRKNADNLAATYELSSLQFSKYVFEEIEKYNELVIKLYECPLNYSIFEDMQRISTNLKSMGLSVKTD